jgi:hypothetical protein
MLKLSLLFQQYVLVQDLFCSHSFQASHTVSNHRSVRVGRESVALLDEIKQGPKEPLNSYEADKCDENCGSQKHEECHLNGRKDI